MSVEKCLKMSTSGLAAGCRESFGTGYRISIFHQLVWPLVCSCRVSSTSSYCHRIRKMQFRPEKLAALSAWPRREFGCHIVVELKSHTKVFRCLSKSVPQMYVVWLGTVECILWVRRNFSSIHQIYSYILSMYETFYADLGPSISWISDWKYSKIGFENHIYSLICSFTK